MAPSSGDKQKKGRTINPSRATVSRVVEPPVSSFHRTVVAGNCPPRLSPFLLRPTGTQGALKKGERAAAAVRGRERAGREGGRWRGRGRQYRGRGRGRGRQRVRRRVLVAAQVEDAQGEYRRGRGRGRGQNAQGDNADDGEDDGEARGTTSGSRARTRTRTRAPTRASSSRRCATADVAETPPLR